MVAAFRRAGLRVDRQKGDHVVMEKEGLIRPVIVPLHDEVSKGVVSTNIRTAGLSPRQYLVYLKMGARPRPKKKKKKK